VDRLDPAAIVLRAVSASVTGEPWQPRYGRAETHCSFRGDRRKIVNTMFWRLFRSLAGGESGRWCRTCGESISPRDPFGISESVCPPCRARA
jgi:hypothetical protein